MSSKARPKANATANLDSSLRATRLCSRRPGRRNSHQAQTKELPLYEEAPDDLTHNIYQPEVCER
jgi:hypothetical protein